MTAKKYKGTPTINKRYGNKTMYLLEPYKMYGIELGIYSDAFDEIVNIIVRRYKSKLQTVIGIQGLTGSAKSTIAIHLCKEVARRLKIEFDLSRDYIYSVGDVWSKLDSEEFSPICLYDEGAVSMNRKRGMSRENQDLENVFTTLRSMGLISFICLPTIDFGDKAITDVHMEYLINVYDERNPLIRNGGKGFFDFNDRRESKVKRKIYWNVLFAGVFPDLDDETKSIYEPIKRQHQIELIKESKKRYDDARK